MECFAFGLGVGHQNSDDQWLDAYYPKALCRPDPAVVKIIADIFGWDGTNLTRQITADDLDDFLEALEDSDDGDAEGLLRALTPLAGSEQPLFWAKLLNWIWIKFLLLYLMVLLNHGKWIIGSKP
jgi:2,3,4,5-tetrahydropyridine-2-carboxylate N-succinyltransferase